MLQCRQGSDDLLHRCTAVEGLAAVLVAIHGEQHLGFDLLEAVNDAGAAKVGRTTGPRGAEAGGGQEGDESLGDVGHVGDDAVTPPHAHLTEGASDGGHLLAQRCPGDFGQRLSLRLEEDGRAVGGGVAEHMLGVAHLRADEPASVGHDSLFQYGGVGPRGLDGVVLPDGGPKVFKVVH